MWTLVWVWCVRILHLLLIAFLLGAIMVDNPPIKLLALVTLFTIMVHWAANNNTCALTLLEQSLTGKVDSNTTFIGSIVNPVYDLKSRHIWIISGIMTFILIAQLAVHLKSIKN